jgi:predicted metalloprotease with PDZ domain
MRLSVITLALAVFCHLGSLAQEKIAYELSFSKPSSHYVEVKMEVQNYLADTVVVRLPVWTPGSYLIREFSRNVDSFEAFVNGKPVPGQKIEKNAWRVIKPREAMLDIRYRVYCREYSVRTSYVNDEQAALIGTTLFMFVPGLENRRHEVRINPPKSWKSIATALRRSGTGPWERFADNYDELVDCPIELGQFKTFSFEAAGVRHEVAMPGQDKFPEAELKRDMGKIVEASTRIFGHQPNTDYLFIIQHSEQGGGGLEHRNSTTLQTRRGVYDKANSYQGLMGLVAHEYFHLWNVKRLRPEALGPFDYNRENYTHNLWFSEGFTSYYDNLLLARTGLMAEEDYLKVLTQGFNAVLGNRGDAVQSLAESSLDAWIKFYLRNENSGNITVSYYRKGAMLGLIFDLVILERSGGAYGLDSLMKRMYLTYAVQEDRGFSDAELQAHCRAMMGSEADSLFAHYVYGTKPMDFARYMAYAGLVVEDTSGRHKEAYLGASFRKMGEYPLVSSIREGSAAWEMGLQVDDLLLEVNGKKVDKLDEWLQGQKPGAKIKLKIWRQGQEFILNGRLGDYPAPRFYIYKQADANAQQELIYEKLVAYPF